MSPMVRGYAAKAVNCMIMCGTLRIGGVLGAPHIRATMLAFNFSPSNKVRKGDKKLPLALKWGVPGPLIHVCSY